ncbi:MAG: tetratricopeptide repeat protein [Bacteroidetes bacterium]|nr:tetratricopeptide repeat protein [Bacteroidota bacterium]MBU1116155.1 tetratricopeptide repeat protein [Bacteroidota bacterium]MBU1800447.1 tetratricopeptide repeat protein [Bacteroidota bacterium]
MNKILYILIILFGASCINQAQNLERQKVFADSLFNSENYFDAITEYKRLQFFSEASENYYEINMQIALCYKAGGKYDDAIKYFNLAKLIAKSSEESRKIELQIIRTNILRRTIPEALVLLNKLDITNTNYLDFSTISYWKGWAYLMNDDWEQASNEFEKIDKFHPLKILADGVCNKKYSVGFAKFISFVLPGSGQFYTGNYVSGVFSLGWNILWGYVTINAFMTDRALEGILVGSLLWTRFYRGNFQNAEKFAIKNNNEISNNAYEYLANKYLGEKP